MPLPVIWNVRSPGVGLGSLTFPIAESWACQVTETMVPEAGSLVARRAGTADHVAGNVVQMTVDEGQVTGKVEPVN